LDICTNTRDISIAQNVILILLREKKVQVPHIVGIRFQILTIYELVWMKRFQHLNEYLRNLVSGNSGGCLEEVVTKTPDF
jgi:hypothetical protein